MCTRDTVRHERPTAPRAGPAAATANSGPMRAAARAKAQRAVPLEYNLLLTATLCLLAFGAVMVYSASSARALLQGQGDGTGVPRPLPRPTAALGLVGMHVVARRGLDGVLTLTTPLLVVRLRLPRGGEAPRPRRRRSTARAAGSAPGRCSSSRRRSPSSRSSSTARGCSRSGPGGIRSPHDVMPLLLVAGTAILLVASQPDLGTALVMAFTVTAMLVAAGHADPLPRDRRRRARAARPRSTR